MSMGADLPTQGFTGPNTQFPRVVRPTPRRRAVAVVPTGVAVLAAATSLAGLLVGGVYGEPVSAAEMLRGYDLVTAVVVAPLLVVSQLGGRRRSDRWRLLTTGSLAYPVYTYAYYLFPTSFNPLFLLHVLIFGASLYGLVLAVAALDLAGIAERFSSAPRRAIAIILAVLGSCLGGFWLYHSVRQAVTGDLPTGSALVEPPAVVHLGIALDLGVLVPAYAVAATLLGRAMPGGYLLAAMVLVSGVLHQVSYMVALVFQAAARVPGAVIFDPFEPIILFLYVVAVALLLRPHGRGTKGRGGGLVSRSGQGA